MFKYDGNTKDSVSDNNGTKGKGDAITGSESILGCPAILTGLSHEVRTYMNSIVAFSFLLNNNTCTDQEKEEYNDHIYNSCEQIITLFDNFLDSIIIDSHQSASRLSKRQLNSVLEELAVDFNRSLKSFNRDKISFILEVNSQTEEIFIDEAKVIRVLRNLFHNALENTDSGYIKLGYKKRENRVIFYVIDSGNSYHANRELLSSNDLGEFLIKHDKTFVTVGLILANQLVQGLGGELWIEPNGVDGSGIYFSIPGRRSTDTPDIHHVKQSRSWISV